MGSSGGVHCSICYGFPGVFPEFPPNFDQDFFLAHFAQKFLFLSTTTDLPTLLSHSPLCQGCTSRLVDVTETLAKIDELQSKVSRHRVEFERDLIQGFEKSGSFRDNYYELRARLVQELNLGVQLPNSIVLKEEDLEDVEQHPQDWHGQDSSEFPEPEVPEPPKEIITPPNLQLYHLKPLKILVEKLELPPGIVTFTLKEFPHLFGARSSKSNLRPTFYKKYTHLSQFFSGCAKSGYRCTFKSETCKFQSVTATEMKIHLLEEHYGDSAKDFYRFRCFQCNFKTWSRQEHTKHMALGHKEYFQRFHCKECDIWEQSQALLDAHNQSTHNGQEGNAPELIIPDVLPDVNLLAFQSEDYERTRHHFDGIDGIYRCKFDRKSCRFMCSSSSYMKLHIRRAHLGEPCGLKRFKCIRCGFKSASKFQLEQHLRSKLHRGLRKLHICKTCGITFKTGALLISHTKTHPKPIRNNSKTHPKIGRPKSEDYFRLKPYFEGSDSTGYRCTFDPGACEFKASIFLRMNVHIRQSHLEESCDDLYKFKCEPCNCKFIRKIDFERHLRTKFHHGLKKPHICKTCGISLKNKALLISHAKTHPKPKNLRANPKIPNCASEDYLRMKPYIEGTKTTGFRCIFDPASCQYKSSRFLLTKIHIRKCHLGDTSDDLYKFKCESCNRRFIHKHDFEAHMRTKKHVGSSDNNKPRTKPNQHQICDICGVSVGNLGRHRLSHISKSPSKTTRTFNCSICGKDYNQKSNYVTHLGKVHALQKNIDCGKCEKTFYTEDLMREHAEKFHRIERNFICHLCGSKLKTKNSLASHIRQVHEKTIPFKCGICGKDFATRSKLWSHQKSCNQKVETVLAPIVE